MRTAIFLLTLLVFKVAHAQNPAKINKAQSDSIQWAKAHYIVNRDSAFDNPFAGLQKLMGGNRRFIEGKSLRPRQDNAMMKELKSAQKPFSVLVSCADSRVPNEIIFDQGLGDLFIIRTAGQVMADASYASIEYAVYYLQCKLVVVLGHTGCGAVAAALKNSGTPPPGHIITLINDIKPAVRDSKKLTGDGLNNAIRMNIINQVNKLRDLEPVLSKKSGLGEILIVGALYNLDTGKVEFLPETLAGMPEKEIEKLQSLQ